MSLLTLCQEVVDETGIGSTPSTIISNTDPLAVQLLATAKGEVVRLSRRHTWQAITADAQIARLREFGRAIGLAFQIVDDVLDVTQSSAQLGKTAGKDTASDKATYPALYGVDQSLKQADALIESGCAALDSFGERAATLKDLARFLVQRKN